MAITLAAAETMNLNSNQVTFVSYSVVTRRQLRDVDTLATFTLSVNIQTSVPLTSSSAAANTYDQYSSLLNSPGAFTSNLRSTASNYDATALTSATVASVNSDSGYDIDQPGNNDDNNNLSGGAIAGIVIGVIIGVGLFAGIIWYFVASGGSSTGRANKSTLDIDVDL
jgi:hypothetical protein